jgi:hypothetical protein
VKRFRKKPVVIQAFQFTEVVSVNIGAIEWPDFARSLTWDGDTPIINTLEGYEPE